MAARVVPRERCSLAGSRAWPCGCATERHCWAGRAGLPVALGTRRAVGPRLRNPGCTGNQPGPRLAWRSMPLSALSDRNARARSSGWSRGSSESRKKGRARPRPGARIGPPRPRPVPRRANTGHGDGPGVKPGTRAGECARMALARESVAGGCTHWKPL
jgi:hypothetical protein